MPAPPRPRHTTLFAKRPDPGAVKTRLVPPLERAEAAELARCMVLDGLERLVRWSLDEPLGPALAYAPADAGPWFREHGPRGVEWLAQRGPDLGARLAAHFGDVLARKPTPTAVVIGADAPLVPRATVLGAHAALAAGAELVLAPDLGGGYALVGLARPAPELFTAVPMSTQSMCERTLELARTLGLEAHVLEATLDVDDAADLVRLALFLEHVAPDHPDFPPRTAAWIRAWERRGR